MKQMTFKQANTYVLEHLREFLGNDLVDKGEFTEYQGSKQLQIKHKGSLYAIALEGEHVGRYMDVFNKRSGDLLDLLLSLNPNVARLAALCRVQEMANRIGEKLL